MKTREINFLTYLASERGLAPATLMAYTGDLAVIGAYLEAQGVHLDDATSEHFAAYIRSSTLLGHSRATIARRIAALRAYLQFRRTMGVQTDATMAQLDLPKGSDRLPDVLSKRQIAVLLAGLDPKTKFYERDLAILELLYATGIRATELCTLTLDNVNLRARNIRVLGKGDRERLVPFGTPAAVALTAYLEGERKRTNKQHLDTVFLSRSGKPLNRSVLWVLVVNRSKSTGKHVHPHTFRHSFATHLLMGREAIELSVDGGVQVNLTNGGANLRVVQELLGHQSVDTTQIYTHVDSARLKRVHALLGR